MKKRLILVVLVVVSPLVPSAVRVEGAGSEQDQCGGPSLETISGCSFAHTKGCYIETQDPYAGLWVSFVCEEDSRCPPERPRMCTWNLYGAAVVDFAVKQAKHLVVRWDQSGWHQLGYFLGDEWTSLSDPLPLFLNEEGYWAGQHITGPNQQGLLVALFFEDGRHAGYLKPGMGWPLRPDQLGLPLLPQLEVP